MSPFLLWRILCSLIFISIAGDKNDLKQMPKYRKGFLWKNPALRYLNSLDSDLRGENYVGRKDGICYFIWLRTVLVLTLYHMLICTVSHFFMPLGITFTAAKAEVVLNVKAHIKRLKDIYPCITVFTLCFNVSRTRQKLSAVLQIIPRLF